MRLIDADALILSFCDNPSYSATMFFKIRGRINAAPTIDPSPQWIPVTERLPENTDDVLVYTNKVAKARYGCDGWHGQGGRWTNVTHWMPMPKPPEDGGAENA